MTASLAIAFRTYRSMIRHSSFSGEIGRFRPYRHLGAYPPDGKSTEESRNTPHLNSPSSAALTVWLRSRGAESTPNRLIKRSRGIDVT